MDCGPPDSLVHGILQARVRKYNKMNYPENKVEKKKQQHQMYKIQVQSFLL